MLEWNSSCAASQTSSAPVVFVVICSGQLSQYTGALQERPAPLLSVSPSLCLPVKTIQSGASVCVCPPSVSSLHVWSNLHNSPRPFRRLCVTD